MRFSPGSSPCAAVEMQLPEVDVRSNRRAFRGIEMGQSSPAPYLEVGPPPRGGGVS